MVYNSFVLTLIKVYVYASHKHNNRNEYKTKNIFLACQALVLLLQSIFSFLPFFQHFRLISILVLVVL